MVTFLLKIERAKSLRLWSLAQTPQRLRLSLSSAAALRQECLCWGSPINHCLGWVTARALTEGNQPTPSYFLIRRKRVTCKPSNRSDTQTKALSSNRSLSAHSKTPSRSPYFRNSLLRATASAAATQCSRPPSFLSSRNTPCLHWKPSKSSEIATMKNESHFTKFKYLNQINLKMQAPRYVESRKET